jgi:L-ascorbate metabolism protein UlaG (beta-lactamase superfamily)
MIKVTFLDNSGFVLTTSGLIMVFDYYKDPSSAFPEILEANPDAPIVFFVSHHHPDHYNKAIFDLAQNHKRVYILSNDIFTKYIPATAQVAGVSPGDVLYRLPGDIQVKAYGSTDVGVSFMVTMPDGIKIFHAGDLNDWHWQDTSTEREVQKAENHFKTILNCIADENPHINIAMFPVDARQGSDFARGANLFLSAIKVEHFFPMHFHDAATEACDFSKYIGDSKAKCHCLHTPGKSTEIE